MNKRFKPNVGRTGYSLIEMALAILIVAVGLLSVFALFPSWLAAGNQVSFETRGAMLAEDIFADIRARVGAGEWAALGNTDLAISSAHRWTGAGQTIRANGNVHTNVFRPQDNAALEDAMFRARLSMDNVAGTGRRRRLRLSLWPGRYGPTADGGGLHFYTEIYRHGM